MKNVICPFCLQDISNSNHAWNCEMNPININNGEFRQNTPAKSLEQSLKEMQLMRDGKVEKRTWDDFLREIEEKDN